MKIKLSIISTLLETLHVAWRNRFLVLILSILGSCISFTLSVAGESLKPPTFPDKEHFDSAAVQKEMSDLHILILEGLILTFLTIIAQIALQAGIAAVLLGTMKAGQDTRSLWMTATNSFRWYWWPLVILVILLTIISVIIVTPFSLLIAVFGFSTELHGNAHVAIHSEFIALMAMLAAILYLVFVKYALAYPLIVIEGMSSLSALSRSWQMTQGFFGYVFGCYVFVGTAEYFLGQLILSNQAFDHMTVAQALEHLVTNVFQCYWVLLAWCMFWRIRDAENSKSNVVPPAWPSALQGP